MNLSVNEVLEALAALRPTDDGAWTADELRQATGWGKDRVMVALRTLARAGKLTITIVARPDISGRVQKKPGYLLK